MATILVGVGAILLVLGWITFDHFRSKRKLDRQHNGVIQSCKAAPETAAPMLSTLDVDTMVEQKAKEVEDLRGKTRKLKAASKDTTRIMKPKPDPQSDTALLKVVVDQAEEMGKAAREKASRKR